MSFADDLAQLTEDMPLDAVPQGSEYPDQQVPAPPEAGNYGFKILKHTLKKDRAGALITQAYTQPDGRVIQCPILTLQAVEIVEPFENGRRINGLFFDVRTKPFERDGKVASGLLDLIRAFDQTLVVTSIKAGLALIDDFAATERTFRARHDWTAYDGDYVDEQFAALGGREAAKAQLTPQQLGAVYDKARLVGMFKFPKKSNGRYSAIWIGPSGNEVEARSTLTRLYPSLDTVKLGPSTN